MIGKQLAMNSSFHPPLATSHKQYADKGMGLTIEQPTPRQVMMYVTLCFVPFKLASLHKKITPLFRFQTACCTYIP